MDPGAILVTSSVVIMFLTLLSISYKTGFVSYSIWSLTRNNQPKFVVRRDKISKFVCIVIGIFLLNIVYGLIVVQGIHEIGAILILSLFNTIVIGYGLTYWVLLKERQKKVK